MKIELDDERRAHFLDNLDSFLQQELDIELSEFKLDRLADHLIAELGPSVYNQAVQDARKFLQERLDDLEGDLYSPEA